MRELFIPTALDEAVGDDHDRLVRGGIDGLVDGIERNAERVFALRVAGDHDNGMQETWILIQGGGG